MLRTGSPGRAFVRVKVRRVTPKRRSKSSTILLVIYILKTPASLS
jgi:hypothetical protein